MGFQSLLPLVTSKLGPSGADSQVGSFMYILGPCGSLQQALLWGREFLPCLNPHRFFQSEVLRLHFPALESWVAQFILLPSFSSQLICTQMWNYPVHQHPPHLVPSLLPCPVCQHHLVCPSPPATDLLWALFAWLPISAPPTGLDECFFFNSLLIGLPYSSIFCQFWLVFVYTFVAVLLLVLRGGKFVYLCLHLSQK